MHYRQSLQLAYWLLFFDLLLGLVACILSGTGLLIADIAATVTYYVQCYINHVLGRPLPVICPPLPPQIPSTLNRPRRVTWADQVPRRAMAGVLAPDPETLDAPKVGVNCSEEERHGVSRVFFKWVASLADPDMGKDDTDNQNNTEHTNTSKV